VVVPQLLEVLGTGGALGKGVIPYETVLDELQHPAELLALM